MPFSVNTAGFGCGLGMESVGPSRFQGLEIADGFGQLYIFHSLGASWVGSLMALSSGSLCLEGHGEESVTEVPMTPQLTHDSPFLICGEGNLGSPSLGVEGDSGLQFGLLPLICCVT